MVPMEDKINRNRNDACITISFLNRHIPYAKYAYKCFTEIGNKNIMKLFSIDHD